MAQNPEAKRLRTGVNWDQRPPLSARIRVARAPKVGTWLSLVERTLGVGEVASSNLVVPTILSNYLALTDAVRGSKHGSTRVQ